MSLRRQTIARRLLEAQSTAAMLTTFNEVDMHAVMALRARRKESFKAKYGDVKQYAPFFYDAVGIMIAILSRLLLRLRVMLLILGFGVASFVGCGVVV